MNNKNRIEWLDIYKGIMIVLVVVGHATSLFNSWIYQFHMAAFFFASGYVFNIKNKNKSFLVAKKICSVLLPFFLISIISFFFNELLQNLNIYNTLFGGDFVGVSFAIKEMLLRGDVYSQYLGTFWFLSALFGVELLHVLLSCICNNKFNWFYILLSATIYCIGHYMGRCAILPKIGIFNVTVIFITQIYYCIGTLAAYLKKEKNIFCDEKKVYMLTFVPSLIIMLWGIRYGIVVDLASAKVRYMFSEIVVASASISLILIVSTILSKHSKYLKEILVYLGKNSMGIMIFHFSFFKMAFIFLWRIGRLPKEEIVNVVLPYQYSLSFWVYITIFSVLGSVVIWEICKKLPIIRIIIGQDREWNESVSNKIASFKLVNVIEKYFSGIGEKIGEFFTESKEKRFVIIVTLFIILALIPYFRTGIIINDELQARFQSMLGFREFYSMNLNTYLHDGRALAAPIISFTMYLGFLTTKNAAMFRFTQILVLLLTSVLFGTLVNKILKNKAAATIAVVLSIALLPISFEHVAPNAFVTLLGIPFIALIISLIQYLAYIEKKKKHNIIISMVLFLLAQMSYETFVTYLILFFLIAIGKTGYRNIFKHKELYIAPLLTSVFYLTAYVISGILFPSQYTGNQLAFVSVKSSLTIIISLFIASMPGFYILMPKYQYLKDIYNNLEFYDYIRIIVLTLLLGALCIYILNNSKKKNGKEFTQKKFWYMVLCASLYMALPSLPISVSSMYQGNVGLNGFLSLPVNYFQYFAAIFLLTILIIKVSNWTKSKYYLVILLLLCVLSAAIQQMNDIISYEQNNNFLRLTEIEKYLNTDVVSELSPGIYAAPDLYIQKNALAITDGYWTSYVNSLLGYALQITSEASGELNGFISYDDDNLTIANNNEIVVLSSDEEKGVKAVKVNENEYATFNFKEAIQDHGVYVYRQEYTNNSFSEVKIIQESGIYPDGWLEKESKFTIKTGKRGLIMLDLYYPDNNFRDKNIEIWLDGELKNSYSFENNELEILCEVNKDTEYSMEIKCDFELINKGNDLRNLSVFMSDINVE